MTPGQLAQCMRKTCPRSKLAVLEGNYDNAVLRMLSASAPSLVAGFWESFARDLDFERLGVEWVPETAQPLKHGKLRLMHGDVWHRVQETGTCTGPDAP